VTPAEACEVLVPKILEAWQMRAAESPDDQLVIALPVPHDYYCLARFGDALTNLLKESPIVADIRWVERLIQAVPDLVTYPGIAGAPGLVVTGIPFSQASLSMQERAKELRAMLQAAGAL